MVAFDIPERLIGWVHDYDSRSETMVHEARKVRLIGIAVRFRGIRRVG